MTTFALCSFGAMAALAFASGGCELIASVDHDKIPQGGGAPIGGGGGGTTTATTSGMGGTGGTGGGMMCNPDDCPEPASDCLAKACEGNMCGEPTNVAIDTACQTAPGEGGGGGGVMAGVCDGEGACVECNNDTQCTVPEVCDETAHDCVPEQCQNMTMDGMETGTDCGGPDCGDCPNGQGCMDAGDCLSGFCNGSNMCAACTSTADCGPDQWCDTTMDGGTCVATKMNGEGCGAADECASGFCPNTSVGGICCDEDCTGQCESCAMVDSGMPNGQCDPVAAGTLCGSGPTCSGDSISPQDVCDDNMGNCLPGTLMPCTGNFTCNTTPTPDACFSGNCTAHTQCASGFFCGGFMGAGGTAGACNPKLGAGQPCSVGAECTSGTCTPSGGGGAGGGGPSGTCS